MIHNKPGNRKTWAYHGEEDFHVGPATDHYMCIQCYIPKIHSERVTDTATFIPSKIPIPSPYITYHAKATSEKLIHLLAHKKLTIGPSIKATRKDNLLNLARLIKKDLTPDIELLPLHAPLISTTTSEGGIINTSTQSTSKISKNT